MFSLQINGANLVITNDLIGQTVDTTFETLTYATDSVYFQVIDQVAFLTAKGSQNNFLWSAPIGQIKDTLGNIFTGESLEAFSDTYLSEVGVSGADNFGNIYDEFGDRVVFPNINTESKTLRGVAHRGGFPSSSTGGQLFSPSIFPVEASDGYYLRFLGVFGNESAARSGTIQASVECPFGSNNWIDVNFNAVRAGTFSQAGSIPDASNDYFRLTSDLIDFKSAIPTTLRVVLSGKGGVPCMSNYDGYYEGRASVEFTIQNSSANDAALQLSNIGRAAMLTILNVVNRDGASMIPRVCQTASWSGGTLTLGCLSHQMTSTGNKIVLDGFINSGVALDGVYSFSTSGGDALTVSLAVDPGTISQVGVARLAQAITSATQSGNTVTITRAAHGRPEGQVVCIRGTTSTGSSINGDFPITSVPTADTFTITMPTSAGTITTTNAYMFTKYTVPSADYHFRPFTILGRSSICCKAFCGDSETQTVGRIMDNTRLCGVLQTLEGQLFPFIDLSVNGLGLKVWNSNPGTVIVRTKEMEDLAQGVTMGWQKNDEASSSYATIDLWKQGHDDWWDLPVQSKLKTSRFNTFVLMPSRSSTSIDSFTTPDGQRKPTDDRLVQFHRFLRGYIGTLYGYFHNYAGQITVRNQPYVFKTVDDSFNITFTTTVGSAAVAVDASTPISPSINNRVVLLPGAGASNADVYVRIRYVSASKFIALDPATGIRIPLLMSTAVTNGTGVVGARKSISYSASQTDSIHENPETIWEGNTAIALKGFPY